MNVNYEQFLMGVLSISFLAWAGVVYTASRKASDLLIGINVKLDVMNKYIDEIYNDLTAHKGKLYHEGAGILHQKEQSAIEELRRDVDRLAMHDEVRRQQRQNAPMGNVQINTPNEEK